MLRLTTLVVVLQVVLLYTNIPLVFAAELTTSRGSDASTVEIAPGVRMPFVSDGIILDAGRWSRNHTGEVKGLDLFFRLGGRGVDTAWSCQCCIVFPRPTSVSVSLVSVSASRFVLQTLSGGLGLPVS